MAKSRITGTQQVINRLMRERDKMLDALARAVEATCVDIANHAKANHAGNQAHMSNRYQNQTSTLTRSIASELEKVSRGEVVGVVYSNMEYAPAVEMGTVKNKPYPYLFPALMANQANLKKRVARAIKR